MLFIKELKKICFSVVYILFVCFMLFSWHNNFYGITNKEIQSSKTADTSILDKPEENAESYGTKSEEVPEKIICGGTDILIIEYLKNSYATYPFTYYKEITLSEKEQAEILDIISEITGLNEKQIRNLPDDYFPAVNGNIIHYGDNANQGENGSFTIEMGTNENDISSNDYTKHFVSQVSYERFKELMKKAENIIGKGSNYSMESLSHYYGLSEMNYDEAMNEYNQTIYDDKVSNAFARLFCDYMTRVLGLYPVFVAVIFWLKDKRNRMNELIDCKQTKTMKLIGVRYLAILVAVILPVIILSFESLIPLIRYSADTGIAIDVFAFLKYITWWLIPTAMIVTSLAMFLTILTGTPFAILIQFVWWFVDSSVTGLSGDTSIVTLMIRHNMLQGSEIISRDFALICLNRGLFVFFSVILVGLSCMVYHKKRGGKLGYDYFIQKHPGFFKNRFSSYFQK